MRPPFHRQIAVSLALAAMLLRALLPDGWMPGSQAAPFTICSVAPAQHDGKPPAGQERTHAPCAFAAAAPLSPPTNHILAPGAPSQAFRLVPVFFDGRTKPTPLHRPNAARAPPPFA